nr:MobV family relaxase [Staphylococcus agnetis]
MRKDAVKHVDGIVTTDKDYFDSLTLEQTRDYFNDSLDFIKDEYGKENILYATVHMDEATPHMHFGFVPITDDGRLSAKQMLGNKKAFTYFQNRYNEHMNRRGYKLERGESKHITGAKHEEMNVYKQKMLNSNQTFRNLVVGFDDKYKEVFMRNDKLNLAKENMYVSQDISIKDMDKRIIESELETSEGFLSIEIDLSDEDFKAYLEEPEKYIVAVSVTMDEESIFVSLEDV